MRKLLLTCLAVLCLALGTSACSQSAKGTGDSPVAKINGHKGGENSPADVTNFPNRFANIATKCVHGAPGYRAFVTTREAAPVILPDPRCK